MQGFELTRGKHDAQVLKVERILALRWFWHQVAIAHAGKRQHGGVELVVRRHNDQFVAAASFAVLFQGRRGRQGAPGLERQAPGFFAGVKLHQKNHRQQGQREDAGAGYGRGYNAERDYHGQQVGGVAVLIAEQRNCDGGDPRH